MVARPSVLSDHFLSRKREPRKLIIDPLPKFPLFQNRHYKVTIMLRLRLLLPLCLFSVVLMGCGGTDGPALDLAPAEGTLTIGGAPLPNALVTFHPESGRPATGRTDDAGHFTLMTKEPGDGAAVGNHKVTVMADSSVSAEINSEDAYTTPDPNSDSGIPGKYVNPNTSGLTAEVTADGENKFTFNLEK